MGIPFRLEDLLQKDEPFKLKDLLRNPKTLEGIKLPPAARDVTATDLEREGRISGIARSLPEAGELKKFVTAAVTTARVGRGDK